MKRAGLLLAVMVVVIANLVVLSGVWYNRSGAPEAVVRLTERELQLAQREESDSGIALRLSWRSEDSRDWVGDPWLDRAKLEALGFDCPPADIDHDIYRYRQVLVVLESDPEAAHLLVRDAGRNYEALRRSYPDRARYIIAPGVVQMRYRHKWAEGERLRGRTAQLMNSLVHVPRQHSAFLAGLADLGEGDHPPRYAVTLRYGRKLEPWVVKVEPLESPTP